MDISKQERTGAIVRWNSEKCFGFIAPDDATTDLFFWAGVIEPSDLWNMAPGVRVRFIPRNGDRGPRAEDVRLLDGA